MNLRILTAGVALSLLAACGGKEQGAQTADAGGEAKVLGPTSLS